LGGKPNFGVGVGASSFMRDESKFYLTHVEFSRLLSEHGVLGLIYFVILIFLLIKQCLSKKPPLVKGILIAFFAIAMYTTFHAAMRTYLTPLFIGLSLMEVKVASPKLRKKEKNINVIKNFKSVL
jgi:O-antigen ligase